jgi:hypothetical protein
MKRQQLDKLETTACSRCSGTGHYSYCQRYGTICFKCSGRKIVYTKRGHAALQFLNNLRTKKLIDLQAGDRIHETSAWTMGNGRPSTCWRTVIRIYQSEQYHGESGHGDGHGNMIWSCPWGNCWNLETSGMTISGLWPDDKFVVYPRTKEEAAEQLRQTLVYQNTLTKQGVPAKIR